MNTANAEVTIQSVLTVGILTGIAVIMYAIWADYEERTISEKLTEKFEDEEYALRLRQIRITSLFPMATQLFIFFGSSPVRWAYPFTCLVFFFSAIFLQTQIQQKLERKLASANPNRVPSADPRKVSELKPNSLDFKQTASSSAMKYIIWSAVSFSTSILILAASVIAFFVLGKWLHTSPSVQTILVLMGVGCGICASIGLVFALAPRQLCLLLPCEPLDKKRPGAAALIKEKFTAAGLTTPQLYVVSSHQANWNNAVLAGFKSGRWIFKPALFISQNLIDDCDPLLLRAIISHEVSHFALNHLRKRFVATLGWMISISFASSLILTGLQFLLKPDAIALFYPLAVLIPILLPFSLIQRQSQKHEFEADAHAVKHLNAGAQPMIKALMWIDGFKENFKVTLDLKQASPLVQNLQKSHGSHPSTQARIDRINAIQASAPYLEWPIEGDKASTVTPSRYSDNQDDTSLAA